MKINIILILLLLKTKSTFINYKISLIRPNQIYKEFSFIYHLANSSFARVRLRDLVEIVLGHL